MKKVLLALSFAVIVGLQALFAQTINITGKVTDAADGSVIPGVSVFVKGTTVGTVTRPDGTYTLSVPNDAEILVFSFVGMTSQEIAIAGKTTINVVLQSDAIDVGEVVVTALGITKREMSIGSSVTSVSNEELTAVRSANMNSALAGKVAGVQISSSSTDPGASSSVVIRGISSISGNNQPLYVIDGVPLSNSANFSDDALNNGFDFGSGANMINPDDVENTTILKGAAATALYGSRAANGVVMITTKKGSRKSKGIGVHINQGFQSSSILRLPDFQNDFGMGWDGHHTEIENGSWGPKFDYREHLWGQIYNYSQKKKTFKPLEDNVRDFFENGQTWNTSVSINGGDENSTFYASYSNITDDGLIPTDADTYSRNTFSVNADSKFGKVKISAAINYSVQENNFAPTGQGLTVINSLYQVPRDVSIVGLSDWKTDPFDTPDYYFTPYGVLNPYWLIDYTKRNFKQDKIFSKLQADIEVTEDLGLTYRLGYDGTTNETKEGFPKIELTPGSAADNTGASYEDPGSVRKKMSRARQIHHDFFMNYSKKINDFGIDAVAGVNVSQREYSFVSATVTGLDIFDYYDLSNSASTPSIDEYYRIRRLVGILGSVDVSYKRLLYLTLSARNDWSSTLPKENNSFFYPGVTTGFVFSELLDQNWMDLGKIRLAYGQTGNDADPYQTKRYYVQGSAYNSFNDVNMPLGGVNGYELGNTLANPSLSPEITTEFEVGLDLRFFLNRIKLDAAYYNRESDGQIFSLDMDAASGYTSQVVNLGSVRNQGIELLLTVEPIRTSDLSWSLTGTFTKNKNEVLSLPEEMGGEVSIYSFGTAESTTSMVARVGHEIGEFKVTMPQMVDGKIVVNEETGLPVADPDLQYYGSINSDYEMGVSTSLNYKGFSVSAALDIRHGGEMYSRTKDILAFTGNSIHTTYNDRNPFVVPNSVNEVVSSDGSKSYVENTTIVSGSNILDYFADGQDKLNADFLIPRGYIKLRDVSLAYNLPQRWVEKVYLKGVRLSVFGSNLFVWTPQENAFIDPELSTFGNDLEGKFGEYSANPTMRRFGYNIQIKF